MTDTNGEEEEDVLHGLKIVFANMRFFETSDTVDVKGMDTIQEKLVHNYNHSKRKRVDQITQPLSVNKNV